MVQRLDLKAGTRFGRLVLTGNLESRKGKIFDECRCDCGKIKWIPRFNLTKGLSKSCGCMRKELTISRCTTHGMGGTRFYKIFYGIKRRCGCASDKLYIYYGGRGIKNLWIKFEDFYDDMYESYIEHVELYGEKETSIDRIDVNGDYCKENCRWATISEQNNNRCSSRSITYKGVVYPTMKSICDELGLNYKRFKKRLKNGWDIIDAIETPKNGKYKKRGAKL